MVSGTGREPPAPAATHTSVLAEEAIRFLAPRPGGLYVDATVGGGGHSARILEAGGRLIGIDRDQAALAGARGRLERFGDQATLVHGLFGDLAGILDRLGIEQVDGLLLDIGLSSIQLDDPARGFAFSSAGPIDMRMDPEDEETPTALELIRRLGTDELVAILKDYGEERFARRIAAHLKEEARAGHLTDTAALARAVEEAIPAKARRHLRIHPATRTFQALRIAVNQELDELDRFLDVFPELLAPGGRCVVISFHSLEDRRVKRRFRELSRGSSLPRHLAEAAGERPDPVCDLVTRKAVFAGEEEVASNPRARSARLRACEKR